MSDLDELLKQMANLADIAWNEETYDLGLARGLSAEDRTTYIAKLMDTARVGDTHAILTLAHLNATAALRMFRTAASSKDPWAQTARRALVIMGHGAEVVEQVARDAIDGGAKMGRVAAVLDLPKIGGPIAVTALTEALDDEDYTVRMLAWDGLVAALGIAPFLKNPEGKRELTTAVELQRILLASDLAAFVKIGVGEMRQLTKQLQAGATPQSLGIAWAPSPAPELFDALRTALFDPEATFPLEEIAKLDGVPRHLAEIMIALRLENQDPRVPEALVKLDAAWAAPGLDEAADATVTSAELSTQLREAARTLRAS